MVATTYSPLELARFREVQQLAYCAAEEVAQQLEPGVTEKQAAGRLLALLERRGVRTFFHRPFAWFGDRTAFVGMRTPLSFFPTDRKLELGMPAILDVAPIVDSYAADIGYAFSLGENRVLEAALDDLEAFRALILARVNAGDTLAAVYRAVDELLSERGYRNCHRKYPFSVVAHRVDRQTKSSLLNVPVLGFGISTALTLLGQTARTRLPPIVANKLLGGMPSGSPFCNVGAGSDAPPEPGLWAFEPHIGRDGVGAKWEEMLLVEPSGKASWLDDDLPHVRRWRRDPQQGAFQR